MKLRSSVAMAIGLGCSCSSDLIPGPGTSICCRCGHKKKKKKSKPDSLGPNPGSLTYYLCIGHSVSVLPLISQPSPLYPEVHQLRTLMTHGVKGTLGPPAGKARKAGYFNQKLSLFESYQEDHRVDRKAESRALKMGINRRRHLKRQKTISQKHLTQDTAAIPTEQWTPVLPPTQVLYCPYLLGHLLQIQSLGQENRRGQTEVKCCIPAARDPGGQLFGLFSYFHKGKTYSVSHETHVSCNGSSPRLRKGAQMLGSHQKM